MAALMLSLSACAPVAEQPAPSRPAAGGTGGASSTDASGGNTGTAPGTGGTGPTTVDAGRPIDTPPAETLAPAAPDDRGIDSASVSGYQLLVRRRGPDGSLGAAEPFDIRGVSWSPAERGDARPTKDTYLKAADRDLPLMREANINVVKTYIPVTRPLLDKLLGHGIVAIVSVMNVAGDDPAPVVQELRDHPAVLMWLVGNEWNFNRLYNSCELSACFDRVAQVARQIKALDPRHPVATSFAPVGELPTDDELRRLEAIDVWGLNVYSQPGFFNRFVDWRLQGQRTGIRRPLFLSEYGADAFDNRAGRADEAAQAAALRRQTQEIRAQLSARNPALPCLGGTPFEWNDEWWKRGSPTAQDPGGFEHTGVAADRFANEEWWGVVDVDRRPRPAYQVLKELYAQ